MKVTKNNFEEEVIKSETPVVLDFWADWCGPCQMLSPIMGNIDDKYDGRVKVGKVNVDEESELAAAFQVSSIPMVVFIKDGKIADSFVGYRSEDDVCKFIDNNL